MTTMLTTVVSAVLCAFFAGTFLVAYTKSKGAYDEYLDGIDKKEYPFRDFIPIGLFLRETHFPGKFLPRFLSDRLRKYNGEIYNLIVELRGAKYASFYVLVHNGNNAAMSVTLATVASVLALIMGVQGDKVNGLLFSALSVGAFAGLPFLLNKSLTDKIGKRRFSIQLDFVEFVNKLTLLVGAGMTISRAWEKIVSDNKKDTPLYNEMALALAEIKAGKPEILAYEEFGRRCKIKEINKFVSVIVLNLKKGGAEVVPVLKVQAMECWEMRKAAAKRLGEEASTKILMPLMIMFVGIIIIVATPAILSFGEGF
jgi:tight adherence protein C